MTWSQAKEEFQNNLNAYHTKALALKNSARNLPVRSNRVGLFLNQQPSANDLRFNAELEKIEKAKKFLASLEEIRNFAPNIDDTLFVDFVRQADLIIQNPKEISYYNNLFKHQQDLHKQLISADSGYAKTVRNHRRTHQFNSTVALCVGGLFLFLLLMGAPIPVVGLLITGGVGLALSLLVAAFSSYQIYTKQ